MKHIATPLSHVNDEFGQGQVGWLLEHCGVQTCCTFVIKSDVKCSE